MLLLAARQSELPEAQVQSPISIWEQRELFYRRTYELLLRLAMLGDPACGNGTGCQSSHSCTGSCCLDTLRSLTRLRFRTGRATTLKGQEDGAERLPSPTGRRRLRRRSSKRAWSGRRGRKSEKTERAGRGPGNITATGRLGVDVLAGLVGAAGEIRAPRAARATGRPSTTPTPARTATAIRASCDPRPVFVLRTGHGSRWKRCQCNAHGRLPMGRPQRPRATSRGDEVKDLIRHSFRAVAWPAPSHVESSACGCCREPRTKSLGYGKARSRGKTSVLRGPSSSSQRSRTPRNIHEGPEAHLPSPCSSNQIAPRC